MSDTLRVRWTITSQTLPEPWLACSRCNSAKPFRCSEKFRLNANGKRLDAWLIYRCVACGQTWNRPLFERRQRNDIEPSMLEALQANDRGWARRFAFDVAGLRHFTNRIEGAEVSTISKEILTAALAPSRLEILLALVDAEPPRLDRLLAAGLDLSRGRIEALAQHARLVIVPDGGKALRRKARADQRILIDLERRTAPATAKAATS